MSTPKPSRPIHPQHNLCAIKGMERSMLRAPAVSGICSTADSHAARCDAVLWMCAGDHNYITGAAWLKAAVRHHGF